MYTCFVQIPSQKKHFPTLVECRKVLLLIEVVGVAPVVSHGRKYKELLGIGVRTKRLLYSVQSRTIIHAFRANIEPKQRIFVNFLECRDLLLL